MIIGILLVTVGAWLRTLINQSFIPVLIGQTLIALSQPFFNNMVSKMSANWFGIKERIYTTAAGSNAN
jgi:hypothetical protein